MAITVDCFGLTDVGRKRRNNEDQFLIADLSKAMHVLQSSLPTGEDGGRFGVHHGMVLLVADGMGGLAGGEVASGAAVRAVARYVLHTMPWFFRVQDGREAELEGELRAALEECRREVEAAAHAGNGRLDRMGTTLTMAYLLWPRLYVVHAGDSRCYLLRDGKAHQITRDHTVAQQMVDRGLMAPEDAATSRWSHALWKCVGSGDRGALDPDVYKATLEPGDTVLLCSDGLSKYIEGREIVRRIESADAAEGAAKGLVKAANDAGGDDNVTVIVARLVPAAGARDTVVDGVAAAAG